eukprot:gnl/MRDRNA2_/MRDRNA2_151019_c0_seq1.p1 gnl/MRDRNA2_/MRDRNA2_151019_c0~~gnl/MRDRNA2_/MRDRNA2_151019_c0_seq1.p1  ORF type:complete len:529 (-),score=57.95 gnl/MRDRNA2_/MRDRNA2_151019_c0_seq1:128-1714(-)
MCAPKGPTANNATKVIGVNQRRRCSSVGGVPKPRPQPKHPGSIKNLSPQKRRSKSCSSSASASTRRHTFTAISGSKGNLIHERKRSSKKGPQEQMPPRQIRSHSAADVNLKPKSVIWEANERQKQRGRHRAQSALNSKSTTHRGCHNSKLVSAPVSLKPAAPTDAQPLNVPAGNMHDICKTAMHIERFAHEFASESQSKPPMPPEDWQEKLSAFVNNFISPCLCSQKVNKGEICKCKQSKEISNKEDLLSNAVYWVARSIELLRDLGLYKKSQDIPAHRFAPPNVKVDSSPTCPAVACYRSWTRTITFGWTGVPWHINVVKLVAAHETWHAAQHLLWGQHHNPCPIIRHQAFEGSAVFFMALCVCSKDWRDTLPTFVDYIMGKSAQAIAAAHISSGAWAPEDARAYEVKHKGCCPLGGLQGVPGTLAYLHSTALLAHDLSQSKLTPQERLLALIILPLDAKHKCSSVLAKIRGSVRWLRTCPKTTAVEQFVWPTDPDAPTAQVLRHLQDIFVVDRKLQQSRSCSSCQA